MLPTLQSNWKPPTAARAVAAASLVVAQHPDGEATCSNYGPSQPMPRLPADFRMLAIDALDQVVAEPSELSELMAREPWRKTGTARRLHDTLLTHRPDNARPCSSTRTTPRSTPCTGAGAGPPSETYAPACPVPRSSTPCCSVCPKRLACLVTHAKHPHHEHRRADCPAPTRHSEAVLPYGQALGVNEDAVLVTGSDV
ncbi:DUF4259 domain-containing protein [Streptomyces anulatus]|uniref:DUF4259 domain-containing protein n=1 Tax=Streptomyces anulatus TaxID=1892 RepID=UPI00344A7E73